MNNKHAVVFKGELTAGSDRAKAMTRLAGAIKKDQAFVEELFSGGLKVLKADLDLATARQYVKALAKLGIKAYTVDLDEVAKKRQGRTTDGDAQTGVADAGEPAGASASKGSASAVAVAKPKSGSSPSDTAVAKERGKADDDKASAAVSKPVSGHSDDAAASARKSGQGAQAADTAADATDTAADATDDVGDATDDVGDVDEIEEIIVVEEEEESDGDAEFIEDDDGQNDDPDVNAAVDDSSDAVVEVVETDGEESNSDIVDGVHVGKSKIIPLDQPADEVLDMPGMELNIDPADEAAGAAEHDRSYESLIQSSEPPSNVLPADVEQIEADKITMSEIGDELDILKDDNVSPLPDISGLSLAGDEENPADDK